MCTGVVNYVGKVKILKQYIYMGVYTFLISNRFLTPSGFTDSYSLTHLSNTVGNVSFSYIDILPIREIHEYLSLKFTYQYVFSVHDLLHTPHYSRHYYYIHINEYEHN